MANEASKEGIGASDWVMQAKRERNPVWRSTIAKQNGAKMAGATKKKKGHRGGN